MWGNTEEKQLILTRRLGRLHRGGRVYSEREGIVRLRGQTDVEWWKVRRGRGRERCAHTRWAWVRATRVGCVGIAGIKADVTRRCGEEKEMSQYF